MTVVVVLVCLGCLMLAMLTPPPRQADQVAISTQRASSVSPTQTAISNPVPKPTLTPKPTPTEKLLETVTSGKPSYSELCDINKTSNLTLAQSKAYVEGLTGTFVSNWKYYVYQVDSTSFGSGIANLYIAYLSPRPDSMTWNISIPVSEKDGLSLKKGDLWEFSGMILSTQMISPGTCKFTLLPSSK